MIDYNALLSRGGLSLDRLITLCRVVEEGGLAKAADGDVSRLSQYSRQLKDLESFFGIPLLTKVGRVAIPTAKAKEIAAAARAHLKTLNGFVDAPQAALPFVLGASQSMLEWYVMPRLDRIRDAIGSQRGLKLMVMRSREIGEALGDYRLDMGLIRKDAVPSGMVTKPVTKLTYALFVPKAMGIKKDARAALESLPLAISMGGELRRLLESATAKEKIQLNIALECTSFSLAANAVRRGLYAAILPNIAESSLDPSSTIKLSLPFKIETARTIVAAWQRSAPDATIRVLLRELLVTGR